MPKWMFFILGLFLGFLALPLGGTQDSFAAAPEVPLVMEQFEDPSRTMGIDDIVAKEEALPWRRSRGDNPRFGYTRSRIWLRFRIPESGFTYGRHEPLVIEVPYAYFERIALYSAREKSASLVGETGMGVPVSRRSREVVQAGYPVFRL